MIPTIILLAQLGAPSCLGSQTQACRLERQLQEQERANQQRHEELMRQHQPPPPPPPPVQFPRVFDGPFKPF